MNYIESLPFLIPSTIISGIYFPECALAGVWGNLLGRIIFTVGYKIAPPMRRPGMMIIMLCNLMMMILSIVTAVFYLSG